MWFAYFRTTGPQNGFEKRELAAMQLFTKPKFLSKILTWKAEKMVKKGVAAPTSDEVQA